MRLSQIVLLPGLLLIAGAFCFTSPGYGQSRRESPAVRGDQLKHEALQQFWPTAEEAAALEAAPALNALGHPKGYFTNPDGVTGYFSGHTRPFNFIWKGPVKTFAALDGQTYQIMDGRGRLLFKYMGDDLLLEKYEGKMAGGRPHGRGKHWLRNEEGGAKSAFYDGELQYGQREGRGEFISYDFYRHMSSPTKYKGEFRRNTFSGQGVAEDLTTGEVFKGWWLFDRPLPGVSQSQWKELAQEAEQRTFELQFSAVFAAGPVLVSGHANDPPGEGSLAVIVPEGAEKAEITGADGRRFSVGPIRHPLWNTEAVGFVEDIPPRGYPLPLKITFEREGRREGVSLIAERPFVLELR